MRSLAAGLLVLAAAAPAHAQTFMPGPEIRYGSGDQIVPVTELPPDVRAALREELKHDVSVGFYYRRWYLFGEHADFWTWGGQFVLYDRDGYMPVSDETWPRLLGPDGLAKLRKPWAYTIPPGLATALGLAGALGIVIWRESRKQRKVQAVVDDPRYRWAFTKFAEATADENRPPDAPDPFAEAVAYLRDQGIPPDEAEKNLRLTVAQACRARSYDLRVAALELEQAGDFTGALDHFEQAAAVIRELDPKDHAFLLRCVERVRKKVPH